MLMSLDTLYFEIKRWLTLSFITISSYSFAAEFPKTQSKPKRLLSRLTNAFHKEETSLIALARQNTNLLSILPREIITELSRFMFTIYYDYILSCEDLDSAIHKINEVVKDASEFKEAAVIEKLINDLIFKYRPGGDKTQNWIAKQLKCKGAKAWLKKIRPDQETLLLAAEKGDLRLARQLIEKEKGVNKETRDYFGSTVLMVAVQHNQLEIVRYLLWQKTEVNSFDWDGQTPLMVAARRECQFAKVLLEHKANPSLKNRQGQTAYTIALELQNKPVLELLESAKTSEPISC